VRENEPENEIVLFANYSLLLIFRIFEKKRECPNPKLKKFGGKASEFSPRARMRHWMG